MGSRVYCLGFGVWGSAFGKVWGLGCRVQGLGFTDLPQDVEQWISN